MEGLLPDPNFDIYQTEAGYVAVTNEVRRTILEALGQQERGLPELVQITGKAKPTLSSVHMKELLSQGLIEEKGHPTDNRKKVYRLLARRIGSSNIPMEQLRSAVKQYASLSPTSARLPLPVAFDALAAATQDTPTPSLRAQATRLGKLAAELLPDTTPRDYASTVATFLDREGVARPLRLDLEHDVLELELGQGFPAETNTARIAAITAGFLDGITHARGMSTSNAHAEPLDAPRRFRLHLPKLKTEGQA